jgi:hypothetical protein
MKRSFIFSLTALSLALASTPSHAVVYCKSVGIPRGCVARPAPVVRAPAAAPRPGNRNGGVNRAGRWR